MPERPPIIDSCEAKEQLLTENARTFYGPKSSVATRQ